MTAAERFIARLEELALEGVEIARRKNGDYAEEDRPFANFETAPLCGVSVERGILVRMSDKFRRVSNLIDTPGCEKVRDESIGDTLSDLANYALILRVWLEWKHAK